MPYQRFSITITVQVNDPIHCSKKPLISIDRAEPQLFYASIRSKKYSIAKKLYSFEIFVLSINIKYLPTSILYNFFVIGYFLDRIEAEKSWGRALSIEISSFLLQWIEFMMIVDLDSYRNWKSLIWYPCAKSL